MNLRWIPFGRMRAAHAVIESSGLPADVQAFVTQVVRRTKLRAAERADVARELCSHFHEAIAAGRAPADAIAAYGDPRASARQVRTAAIAKRHVLDRAAGTAFTAIGYACVAFVAAYAAFTLYLQLRQPVISVDSLARFRERLAVPAAPADDAWPHYRAAFMALGMDAGTAESKSPGQITVSELHEPGDPSWAETVAWLDAHRDALATLRDAARRPVFGFPAGRAFDAEDERLFGAGPAETMRQLIATRMDARSLPMLGILLPQLAGMRNGARVLAYDAFHAAESGDGERMVADLEAMMAMSIHVQDGRILIGDLVGMAIRAMARTRAIELLEWKPDLLDDARLARLQRALTTVPPALERLDLDSERLFWTDLEQRFFTDDGDGAGLFRMSRDTFVALVETVDNTSGAKRSNADGTLTIAAVLPFVSSPAAALLIADRRETHDYFERRAAGFERLSALPVRDRAQIDALEAELEREFGASPLRLILPRLLLPAFGRASFAFAQDRAWSTAAGAACAVVRFHRANGAWPRTWGDVVPAYLAAVPEDPWTGKPARMAGQGGEFRVWSLGEDGNDEGGDPQAGNGLADSASPSTRCFLNDARQYRSTDGRSADRDVDWVWYAPRSAVNRWRLPEEGAAPGTPAPPR